MDREHFNIDLIDRMLRFANLPESEITSARKIEAIFEDHPDAQAGLFKHVKLDTDVQSLIQLRDDLRDWLRVIASEQWSDAVKVRDEMLRRYQEKATLTATIRVTLDNGEERELPVELWGLPHLEFEHGQLTVGVQPFLTGVESAVYFAVIILFSTSRKIGICQAPLPNQKRIKRDDKKRCGKFFLKTEDFRVVCSKQCSDLRRREQVSQSVTRFVTKQAKKRSRGKSTSKKGGKNDRRKK
jgi:hypothetical protein